MVKGVINGTTTLYVNGAYQIANGVVTKYYPGGAFRVNGVLYFTLGDHLGSTSITASASGAKVSELRYTAWGGIRYTSGTTPSTDRTYTGQRSYAGDFGLMYYNARWYDPGLGRFAQADTIIPGGPQGLDRYAYGLNNPSRYTDPSGHTPCDYIPDSSSAKARCEAAYPTQLDPGKLSTTPHNNTKVSAADVYSHYLTLWANKAGWWWKAYGNDADGFTLWDYMSLYAFNEGEYHPEYARTMAEGAVREFYERAQGGYNTNDIYGMVDWWAGFSQSAASDVKNGNMPYRDPVSTLTTIEAYRSFSVFGNLFSSPPDDWMTGAAQDRPYGWGNASVYATYSSTAKNMLKTHSLQTNIIFIYIPGDDPFYVPSYCADVNWLESSGTDSKVCNFLGIDN